MIREEPDKTPVTTPVADPIPANEGLPLLQIPPDDNELNTVVPPVHTEVVPVIADGNGLTVTGVVTVQPVPRE